MKKFEYIVDVKQGDLIIFRSNQAGCTFPFYAPVIFISVTSRRKLAGMGQIDRYVYKVHYIEPAGKMSFCNFYSHLDEFEVLSNAEDAVEI